MGNEKTVPRDARITLGLKISQHSGESIIPQIPA